MKRLLIFTLLVAMCFCSTVVAQSEPAQIPSEQQRQRQEELGKKEKEARELAQKVLDGRQVVVRVYNDWQADPAAFELVSIPLSGLTLEFDSIKSASARISDSTVIVLLGEDQKDEAVAAVVGDYVWVRTYRGAGKLHVWPPSIRDPGHKWWMFVDALGNPIPNASVEIRICPCDEHASEFLLGMAMLDEQGRLRRIKRGDSLSKFAFVISHADYGTANVTAGCCPSLDDPFITYIVPLVPVASEAGSRAIWGFVGDPQGRPISGAELSCFNLQVQHDKPLPLYKGFIGKSITDEQGWFAMYMPVEKDGVLASTPIPPMVKYYVTVQPPKFMNLRHYEGQLIGGKQSTVTLTTMKVGEHFHTFAFEYADGPITDIAELEKITVTLHRDEREWASLEYDAWKDGAYLPSGILCASRPRWGYHFSFEPIELTPDSPEQLVFRARRPIVYRGMVVNGATDEPMPNVLVLTDKSYFNEDPCSVKAQQWKGLRAQAADELAGSLPESKLYDFMHRVTLTDPDGYYQITFMPGLNNCIFGFTALEKGFVAEPVRIWDPEPGADRVVTMSTIRLMPTDLLPEEVKYFPTFVIEDESGPVTDPKLLAKARIAIAQGNGRRTTGPYSDFLKREKFLPGIYNVTADWNGKHYIFEPVDLTEERPDTIVFKIKEIKEADIVYQGQVVHGVTGAAMPGVIIMAGAIRPLAEDGSRVTAEQWDVIYSLGPKLDADDSNLAPLKEILEFVNITRTDSGGWFQIALPRGKIDGLDHLVAIENDYLGAQQSLELLSPTNRGRAMPAMSKEPELDDNGYVTLPTMKLFPAGTVIVEPNVPDFGYNEPGELRFHWRPSPDDKTPWLQEFGSMPVFYKYELRPNQIQTAYVVAGIELTIRFYRPRGPSVAIAIPGIKLEQGEVLDLGRLDFKPAIKVAVKVVDVAGGPVEGVRVTCLQEDGSSNYQLGDTDSKGLVFLHVAPHSKGQFVVIYHDRATQTQLEESTPYEVGGEEDAGREFILQISDEMLARLLE